ncbi:ASCH domain-containing protein [Photobacterium damselae]|uniref:ASCH domain-containing protein n=1 Tax=Photobacterium damselae TaxID=38293 RepID=UPI002F3EB3BF
MQCINFSPKNFSCLSRGKTTTIRLGDKVFCLGPVKLLCSEESKELDSDIIEIKMVRFGDLGLSDAVSDGFNTIESLRRELENCYEKLVSDFEPVTIVRFGI